MDVLVWYLPDLQGSFSIVFYYVGVILNNRLPTGTPPSFACPLVPVITMINVILLVL